MINLNAERTSPQRACDVRSSPQVTVLASHHDQRIEKHPVSVDALGQHAWRV